MRPNVLCLFKLVSELKCRFIHKGDNIVVNDDNNNNNNDDDDDGASADDENE